MMDLSSSLMVHSARQLGGVLGEAASRQTLGAALRLLQESAKVAQTALPGEVGLEWLELANKLEAFEHFQDARLDLAAGERPLAEQVLRAAALGPYRAVWTVEGLGYARARSAWAAAAAPGRLLADLRLEGLPLGAVLPLHTGAGLCFADRLLAADGARNPEGLARWHASWEENAGPGYGCIAVEALGLVARNLHPYLLSGLGELLGSIDPVLAEHLWHGAGRGLYFAPTHAVPHSGALGRAFEKAWREPPDEPGRRNATAGLAWALTLVNLRHPAILAGVLRRHDGEIGSAEAFSNGVASAVLVWYDIVGLDFHLDAFLAHRPDGRALAALWRDRVVAPCEEALQHTYPRLRQSGGMAPLFRCPPGKGVSRP